MRAEPSRTKHLVMNPDSTMPLISLFGTAFFCGQHHNFSSLLLYLRAKMCDYATLLPVNILSCATEKEMSRVKSQFFSCFSVSGVPGSMPFKV